MPPVYTRACGARTYVHTYVDDDDSDVRRDGSDATRESIFEGDVPSSGNEEHVCAVARASARSDGIKAGAHTVFEGIL